MKRICMAFVLCTFFSVGVFAQKSKNQSSKSSLSVTSVNAIESGVNFDLRLTMTFPGMSYGDDCYSEDGECPPSEKMEFDLVDAYNYITVTPNVKFTLATHAAGLSLIGRFQPNTNYKVSVTKGLSTLTGVFLSQSYSRDIQTGSLRPFFKFKSKARYLPVKYSGEIQWEALNMEDVEVVISRIPQQNLHQWSTSYATESVMEEMDTRAVKIQKVDNRIVGGKLSLKDFSPLGKGVYIVEARSKEKSQYGYHTSYDRTQLIVTDLAIVAKIGLGNEMQVWSIDKNDLSPLKGAEVELLSANNIKMASCETGSSVGGCSLKWSANSKLKPFSIRARKAADFTYLRLSDLEIANDRLHVGNRDFTSGQGGFDAYIFSERDLYRPGETVHLTAMVRNAQMEAIGKLALKWKIMSPRGTVVSEAVTTTSTYGQTEYDLVSAASFDTGKYTAQLEMGDKVLHSFHFLIEEFVPERIGVKLKPKKDFIFGAESFQFDVQANYLFGPPVESGDYKTTCSIVPAFKRIPGMKDYWTGSYSKEAQNAFLLETKTGRLSDKGASVESCAFSGKLDLREVYELRAQVDVQEAGSGRATVQSTKGLVAATDKILGLKLQNTSGRKITIEGQTFSVQGKKVAASGQVDLKLFQIRENWYYAGGGYGEDESGWKIKEVVTPAGGAQPAQLVNGKFEAQLTAPEGWGRWMVRAVDKKTNFTSDIVVGYLGYGWFDEDMSYSGTESKEGAPQPQEIEVKLNQAQASPGDQIEVGVVAPFTGRILLTVESDVVHASEWIEVKKPGPLSHKFKVPNRTPNVYINALLLKNPAEAGGKYIPARAFGGASLRVIPSQHIMSVKMLHPELTVSRKTIEVSLSNSAKEEVEYTLAAVDEGILQITKYKSPNPQDRFFDSRKLGVTTYDTLGWTFAFLGATKTAGGDGVAAGGAGSMPVQLVAFWYPKIKSDKSGAAKVKLNLPSFQGKLRLMVVASGKSKMGAADSYMTVRDPLVLQPTLPRFFTSKDKVKFPVAVTNMSGQTQEIQVRIEHDSLLKLENTQQKLELKDNEQKVLFFPTEVTGVTGLTQVKVSAQSKDKKLQSEEIFRLKVQPDGVEQNLRITNDTKKPVQLKGVVPTDWQTNYLKVSASISNMPYVTALTHLEHLVHYPYGCIEQTTSSTMPLLAVGDILERIEVKPRKAGELKQMVQSGIDRVFSMQTGSGGFGYWPGAQEADLWGTAYASFMLIEAKKLGYQVTNSNLDSALAYLLNELRSDVQSYNTVSSSAYYKHSALPFVAYVLVKGGKNITAELRKLAAKSKPNDWGKASFKWQGLAGENFFLLAAAARQAGDKETLKILADETVYTAQLVGQTDYEYTYWSSLRSDGLRLAVLEDIWPKDSKYELLAERISKDLSAKSSSMYSTQEIAWAVLALGKRLRNMKTYSAQDLAKVNLTLDGKVQTRASGKTPNYIFEGAKYAQSTLGVVPPATAGGLWLYTTLTGFTAQPPKGSGQLKISRSYLNKSGTSLSRGSIKSGDTFVVAINIENMTNSKISNLAVVDRLPAGLEVENTRLGRGGEFDWAEDSRWDLEYMDVRDDRVQAFGDLNSRQQKTFYYTVRAVTAGEYTAPAPLIEAMYEPEYFSYGQNESFKIAQ